MIILPTVCSCIHVLYETLIVIQGQTRAGSLSQHALSESQRNTLDTELVYHYAHRETRQTAGHPWGPLQS